MPSSRIFLFFIVGPWTLGLALALFESRFYLAIPWPIVQRVLLSWLYAGISLTLLAGALYFTGRLMVAVSLGVRCPDCGTGRELRCVRIRPFGRRYFVCRNCGGKWTRHALSDVLNLIGPEEEKLFPIRLQKGLPEPWFEQVNPMNGSEEVVEVEDQTEGLAKILRERKEERARREASKKWGNGRDDSSRSPETTPEPVA